MTIKKQYNDIHSFLVANKTKKISTVLVELEAMMEAKVRASTIMRDENGTVIAIFCYYHKQWEVLANTPYGKKASSTSGYNTMCKVGVSNWTKQQNLLKAIPGDIMAEVEAGKLDVNIMTEERKVREIKAKTILQVEGAITFDTEQDVLDYLNKK